MRHNTTLARLRSGQPALGLWLQTHSFHTARIVAANGIVDWIVVDMEHTPVDLSTASSIFATVSDVSAGICTPIARVAQGSLVEIRRALDAGAQGVIVPMVNTPHDAAEAVRYSRYPPLGERGAGGFVPHFGFGTTNHIEYIGAANKEILVSVMIETRTAVENIDAILDVPGIDMAFIGPLDLHVSLGLPPATWSDSPEFRLAIKTVIDACRQRDLPYGTLSPSADAAAARVSDGFTFVGVGTDIAHLLGSLTAQTKQVRAATLSAKA